MSETTQTNSTMSEPAESRQWRLLLTGPVVWSVYFLVAYFLVEIACGLELLQFTIAGLNAILVVVVILTFVALIPIVRMGLTAFRQWQSLRQDAADSGEQPAEFMAYAGLLLAGLFALMTAVAGIVVAILSPCSWV